MKLTIDSITNAMQGNDFWLNPLGDNAQIVAEATKRHYLKRLSWTQIQWTEEGLKRARQELDQGVQVEIQSAREEEARQIAKERYSVVKGLWIEPSARVQTTSDGKRHVLCWIRVDE